MKLVIVESPTKAKSIGQFLGSDYEVIASKGHIRDIRKDPFGVDIDDAFKTEWVYIKERNDDSEKIVQEIKERASKASEVIIATDPDREGEAIAWHLCEVLGIPEDKPCRITYQEITESAVRKALQEPRPIDMDLVRAALSRSIIDYIIGFKVSPLLWKKYCSGLSAGRVQTAVLDLIIKQEIQRKKDLEANARPTHWSISAKLEKDGISFNVDGSEKYPDELSVKTASKDLLEGPFVLSDIKVSGIRESRPDPPFKTSTLMRSAMSHLGYDTSLTQSLAQDLFEKHHLITYIRTDAVFIAEEFQDAARTFIASKYGQEYLPVKAPVYQSRPNAQEAHEAIRPVSLDNTPAAVKARLSDTEYKLYKLIYERFIASQMVPSRSRSTQYTFLNSGQSFGCSRSEFVFDGFRRVFGYGLKQEQTIPPITIGDKVPGIEVKCVDHYKMSTPHYNQASLVEMMETCGIGRPSTYASTIKILKDRGYVEQENKSLLPKKLGYIVDSGLQASFPDIFDIKKIDDNTFDSFTAKLEEQLDQIALGEADWIDVLSEFWGTFSPVLENAARTMKKWHGSYTDKYCPVCGGRLIERLSKYGVFYGCDNYTACNYSYDPPEYTEEKCKKCGAPMERLHKKNGTVFTACSNPECNEHAVEEDPPLSSKPRREWVQSILITRTPVKITKFAKRIKKAAETNGQVFENKYITDNVNHKFSNYGYLEYRRDKFGVARYLPTAKGRLLGITTMDIRQKEDTDDMMEIAVLSEAAQRYFINNLL